MLTPPPARVASQHEQAGATATAPANEAPPATVSSRVLSALFKVMRFVRVHRPEANENPRPLQVATETVGMTSTQGSDLRSRSASAHPSAGSVLFSSPGQEPPVQAPESPVGELSSPQASSKIEPNPFEAWDQQMRLRSENEDLYQVALMNITQSKCDAAAEGLKKAMLQGHRSAGLELGKLHALKHAQLTNPDRTYGENLIADAIRKQVNGSTEASIQVLLAKGQEFYVQANLKHNLGRLVEAVELYQEAIKLENNEAKFSLGILLIYNRDPSFQGNPSTGLSLIEAAANDGHNNAGAFLQLVRQNGGIGQMTQMAEKQYQTALALIKENKCKDAVDELTGAMNNGHPAAVLELGKLHLFQFAQLPFHNRGYGETLVQNAQRIGVSGSAQVWDEVLMTKAQCSYEQGYHKQRKGLLVEAAEHYEEAIKYKSKKAKFELGMLHYTNKDPSFPNDPIKGMSLINEASNEGDLGAQYFMKVYLKQPRVSRAWTSSKNNTLV